MGHFLHFHPITVAALLIFALAAIKGGPAERLGALLMAVDWLLSMASAALAGREIAHNVRLLPANLAVFIDFFFSLGLLLLALRYSKLWLGAALVLQGLTLAMHALSLSPDAPGFFLYAATLNIATCLLLFSLLLGSVAAGRSRGRRRGSRGTPEFQAAAFPG